MYTYVYNVSMHIGEGGMDYGDNLFRFALFAWAALEAPLVVPCGGVPYGEDIVFLANDWQVLKRPHVVDPHVVDIYMGRI